MRQPWDGEMSGVLAGDGPWTWHLGCAHRLKEQHGEWMRGTEAKMQQSERWENNEEDVFQRLKQMVFGVEEVVS